MATTDAWGDPSQCPFCGEQLPSPGSGFVDHVHDSETCETEYERWVSQVRGDMRGGWGG